MELQFDDIFNMSTDACIDMFTDIFQSSKMFYATDIVASKMLVENGSLPDGDTAETVLEGAFMDGVKTLINIFSKFIEKMREAYGTLKKKFQYFQRRYIANSGVCDDLLKKVQLSPILLKQRECKIQHNVYKFCIV